MSAEKVAMVKHAEIGGVVAALIDAEYIKVADEEVFADLVGEVSERVGDDYTLESVVEKTAEIVKEAIELDAETIDVPTEPEDKEGPEGGETVAKENMKMNDDTDGGMAATDSDMVKGAEEDEIEKIAASLETITKALGKLTGKGAKETGKAAVKTMERVKIKPASKLTRAGRAVKAKAGAGAAAVKAKGTAGAGAVKAKVKEKGAPIAAAGAALKGGAAAAKTTGTYGGTRAGLSAGKKFVGRRAKASPEVAKGLRQMAAGAGAVGVGGAGYAAGKRRRSTD